MGHQYSVVFEHEPDPLDLAFLEERLAEAAVSAAGVGDEQEFAVIVRDGGRIVAGASGAMWGGGCQLHVVWVDQTMRHEVWDETSWPSRTSSERPGLSAGHGPHLRRPDGRLLRTTGLPDSRSHRELSSWHDDAVVLQGPLRLRA